MSEIDPMVQQLVDSAVHHTAVYRNGDSNRKRVNELSRKLTARLAAAKPSRKDIRAAVYEAGCKTDENFWTLWTDTPESSINMWLDAITDAVMAVLEPEQGGVGDERD